jgi:hypothetical protein
VGWICYFVGICHIWPQIFCKELPNAQPNLPTNASTVSDKNNWEMFFLLGPSFALYFSFCESEIQFSRQHAQFYSCLSNFIWILKIIETNECSFIFLFFYSLVVSDIT